jgi:glucose uptake protein GlcU
MVGFGVGIVCAIACSVFYGVQYVPCKKYNTYDGCVFQWFMACGIMMGGIVLEVIGLLWLDWPVTDPQVILHGVACGLIWGFANSLVIPLLHLTGLALGFTLYHIVNLCTGYTTSRFGLFGMKQDSGSIPLLRDMGVVVLIISFVALCMVEPENEKDTAKKAVDVDDVLTNAAVEDAVNGSFSDPPLPKKKEYFSIWIENPRSRRIVGIVLSICAGIATGLNTMPFDLWKNNTPEGARMSDMQFVFSQCVGVFLASSIIYWCQSSYATIRGKLVHHVPIRPALIGGILWVLGDITMLFALTGLGYAAGYTIGAVGPTLIASCISFFVYKEIREKRQRVFFISAFVLQIAGVLMICLGT